MVLISNCRECIGTAGDYFRKALNVTSSATLEAAKQVCELAKKIIAIALPTLLIFAFSGPFITGIGLGVIFPEHSARTIRTISQILENKPFLARIITSIAIGFFFWYGLPYTPYMVAALCGANLGSIQALQAAAAKELSN